MSAITWHKAPDVGDSAYEARIDGEPYAVAVKTGTHLDNYPWEWYIIAPGRERKSSGVSETLRSAKQATEAHRA